ncbi:MAG: HD domain-containing protein [Waddliaceae bacterium]|nr:HD domain-containing protein [Waddliaceae bacterium]MBT6929157.1 HD domain-containing protein [Waddliaceae bacterium]
MMESIVNFLNEVDMLTKIPRSGYAFLGSGKQSVAEHTLNTIAIGYALAHLYGDGVDEAKLLKLCVFHDLPESRVGDHNYVQKRYVSANMENVFTDIGDSSPLGAEVVSYIEEFERKESLEAKLARDADNIEMLLMLKREIETGNPRGQEWYNNVKSRVVTEVGKNLAEEIATTPSDAWWKKYVIH